MKDIQETIVFLCLEDVFDYAIMMEKQTREFFGNSAEKLRSRQLVTKKKDFEGNYLIKLFQLFEQEELKHVDILLEMKKNYSFDQLRQECNPPLILNVKKRIWEFYPDRDYDFNEICSTAKETELFANRFYLQLHEVIASRNEKKLADVLKILSDMEEKHYKQIVEGMDL